MTDQHPLLEDVLYADKLKRARLEELLWQLVGIADDGYHGAVHYCRKGNCLVRDGFVCSGCGKDGISEGHS